MDLMLYPERPAQAARIALMMLAGEASEGQLNETEAALAWQSEWFRDSDEDVALLEAARNELLIARDAGNFVHPEDVQDS